jgi:hypothetical protein
MPKIEDYGSGDGPKAAESCAFLVFTGANLIYGWHATS